MKTSRVTTKGQITIPAETRKKMGIHQGDRVGFIHDNGKIIIMPIIKDIASSFGLIKARTSVSLDDMDQAIQGRGGKP